MAAKKRTPTKRPREPKTKAKAPASSRAIKRTESALVSLGWTAEELGKRRARNRVFLALVDAGGPARHDALWWVQAIAKPLALADFSDPIHRAAYAMIGDAMRCMLVRDAAATARVRLYDAHRHGSLDPDSDALAIRRLASRVEIAAHLYRHKNEPDNQKVGPNAAKHLRTDLGAQFGDEATPAEDELEDWLRTHVPNAKPNRGQVTTKGIVVRIMRRGNLFGTRPAHTEQKTLARVDSAMRSRAAK